MPGVFPEISNGGVIVRDLAGNPTGTAGVGNAYVPPVTFNMSCPETLFGSDCTVTRWRPELHNAIVSELLAFAVLLNPNGSWVCSNLNNIAVNFEAWMNGTATGTLGDIIAKTFKTCAGASHVPGALIPTCNEMTAAIADAIAALPADKFLQGLQSYNAATNVMTLLMSDGSTVPVDMSNLIADALDDFVIVSGDAGNLITVGTDGGAFVSPASIVAGICANDAAADSLAACLVSTDAGNALGVGGDGRLFVSPGGGGGGASGASTDVGNLLSNGSDGLSYLDLASLLADPNGDAIASAMISADANNGLGVGSDGRLFIDLSNVPALWDGVTNPPPVGSFFMAQNSQGTVTPGSSFICGGASQLKVYGGGPTTLNPAPSVTVVTGTYKCLGATGHDNVNSVSYYNWLRVA